MSSPDQVALSVKMAARFIYFGIKPEVGAYISPEGTGNYSNLEPWPMYKLTKHVIAEEKAGTAYFLTIQVRASEVKAPVPSM